MRAQGQPQDRFTIGEITAEFGITARAVRFYEEEGLLAPERQGQARLFSRRDRARLAWILRAKSVGFSLSEVRELIDLYDLGDGRVEQRRVAVLRCNEKIEALRRQRSEIDAAIAGLEDFVTTIESLELPRRPADQG